jgi:ubiquinone/menaquinone biosynthesis C-methylase UbiE
MSGNDASFVGSIPQYYDQGLGPLIFVDYADDMARRVAAAKPMQILETAAGTGIVTRRLRDRLDPGAALTATDLNAPMLEIARGKFKPEERVAFQPADAQALPFGDASFDVVVCQFGIMFFPDKQKSFREVHRVLKPGGRYFLSVWDSHRYNPFGRIAHEAVGRVFPKDPPQFYTVPFSCHQIDPVKEWVLDAGFTDLTVNVIHREKEISDSAAFARGMILGNPLSDQVKQRGGDPEELVAMVLQDLHRSFGADPGHMPLQAIFYSAQKPA